MREVHGAMTDSHSVSTGVSEEDEGGGQWVSVRLNENGGGMGEDVSGLRVRERLNIIQGKGGRGRKWVRMGGMRQGSSLGCLAHSSHHTPPSVQPPLPKEAVQLSLT